MMKISGRGTLGQRELSFTTAKTLAKVSFIIEHSCTSRSFPSPSSLHAQICMGQQISRLNTKFRLTCLHLTQSSGNFM
jgi:hypothetical protein